MNRPGSMTFSVRGRLPPSIDGEGRAGCHERSDWHCGDEWAHLTPDSPALPVLEWLQGSTEGSVTRAGAVVFRPPSAALQGQKAACTDRIRYCAATRSLPAALRLSGVRTIRACAFGRVRAIRAAADPPLGSRSLIAARRART